ncbi:ribonuclease H-like domain-containing protein [Haematococcus lacustris]
MTLSNKFAALNTADECLAEDAAKGNVKAAAARARNRFENPLVWVDLEMTGLDIEKDTIIEIAVIITDGDLKEEAVGPALAIHASEEVLAGMNEWCIEHHGQSGLTQRVRDSAVTMQQAEEQVMAFIQQYVSEAGTAQMAGNSVHVDRMFLNKHMPTLVSFLSYRIVDVSSVKELARRWFPKEYRQAPRKKLAHTALSDIKESLAELRYYRKAVFKSGGSSKS